MAPKSPISCADSDSGNHLFCRVKWLSIPPKRAINSYSRTNALRATKVKVKIKVEVKGEVKVKGLIAKAAESAKGCKGIRDRLRPVGRPPGRPHWTGRPVLQRRPLGFQPSLGSALSFSHETGYMMPGQRWHWNVAGWPGKPGSVASK